MKLIVSVNEINENYFNSNLSLKYIEREQSWKKNLQI